MKHNLHEIVAHFPLEGVFLGAAPYGNGHINDTYVSRWDVGGRVVHSLQQRINHMIFREPLKVMDNILRVTRHLRERLSKRPGADPARECLTVVPARDGQPCYVDPGGNCWRTYVFVERARSYDVCEGPRQAREAAQAFGRFQQLLVDLPGGRLHETIPFFHHTPRRFAALEQAIATAPAERRAAAGPEIEFALARRDTTSVVTDLLESGRMPVRTTHNDTKLSNVLIDDSTGRGVCVIDLDTVMGGAALYDFGDLVRTCTPTAPEDEPDLARVQFRMDVFEALVEGYLQYGREFLTPVELEHLPFAGPLITFTIGIRFLADYLAGDVYFKVHRPGHNLERARVQFRMMAHMESRRRDMEAAVRRWAAG